jgi:hypothetical protein
MIARHGRVVACRTRRLPAARPEEIRKLAAMADQLISPRNGQVALPDQGRKPFAMAWQRSGTTLHKSIGKELLNGGSSEPTWRPPSCPQARMVQGPSRSLGLAAPRCDWSRSCKKISLPRFRLCGWSSIRTALDLHSTAAAATSSRRRCWPPTSSSLKRKSCISPIGLK